jgi:hypothetical protein
MHTNISKSDISIKFDHPKENSIETEISIPQRKSSRQKSFHRESFNNDDYGYDQEKDDTFHEYINEKLQAVDYECSGHIPGTLFWYDDDNDVYLEYYSGKGFHINYSVYMSYVKHINSSSTA